jgi:hypothetical protein
MNRGPTADRTRLTGGRTELAELVRAYRRRSKKNKRKSKRMRREKQYRFLARFLVKLPLLMTL